MIEWSRLALFGLVAIFISIPATSAWIYYSKQESLGQEIREEGNKAHYKKQGTPTMGGVAFTLVFLLLLFLCAGFSKWTLIIAAGTLGFGGIGFLDDLQKVRKHESEGLTPRQKLILQFVFSALLIMVVYLIDPSVGTQKIPLIGINLHLSVLWIPVLAFIMVGTVNAVNLTDGLDGLCGGVSIPVFLTIALLAINNPFGGAVPEIAAVLFAGVLVGFLFYNSHPAALFMGDTGSMAIGGALTAILLVMNRMPYLLILGGVYLVEALSVMIQVAYFKRTGGKRIFLMSPIHHHFELKGYAEEKVTAAFTLVSLGLCLLAIVFW